MLSGVSLLSISEAANQSGSMEHMKRSTHTLAFSHSAVSQGCVCECERE